MTSRFTAAPRLAGLILICALAMLVPHAARAAPSATVVMDARSGEIIFARNHETRLHPASLTKMMTLYIAFEAVQNGEITMDTMVTISRNAAAEPCSCLGLRPGQRIALRYLVRAAAVRSGNDAATAIGEAISGSEAAFADRMTRTARAMGMNNTTFRNAHGLTHPEHLSTARDMTILGRQLFFDYPQYYNLFSRRSTDAGIATVVNTNRRFLDAYRGADGIKTGYTRAAGFNLVGSAERGGKRIIATVFGGTSVAQRNTQMSELLDLGFGRAPAQVAVRRPPAPNYTGSGRRETAETPVARTVRLQTTIARSPIPPLRPTPGIPVAVPAEALAALAVGIDAALAETQAELTPAAVETVVAAASQPAPADPPFAVVAEADLPELAASLPAPRPEPPDTESSAEASAETVMAAAASDPAQPLVEVARARALAPPRPEGLAPEAVLADAPQAARAADQDADQDATLTDLAAADARAAPGVTSEVDDLTLALQAATALDAAETSRADAPKGVIFAALPDLPVHVPAGAPEPSDLLPARAADAPPSRGISPGDIVLTSSVGAAAPGARRAPAPTRAPEVSAAPAPAEVVSRTISTSDARRWGVHVGRYGSRFEAERALIQTSLSELSSLEGAVRRVQPRSGGFEAQFVGLSRDQADLACRRLQARDRLCFTLAP